MPLISFATPAGFEPALHPPSLDSRGGEEWFLFSKDRLLVSEDKKSLSSQKGFPLQRELYLGMFRERPFFVGEVEGEVEPPRGWQWISLRSLYGVLDEGRYALAGRALQLVHWDRSHQFCGCCGSATAPRQQERCRECPKCGHLAYPKVAPVVMVLVKKGDQILLARSPHFPGKTYSVLAGFVDIGETLEQCIEREVWEEVGIRVKNIHYFQSQPWPFSHSLMIGFTCEWLEGEIRIDPAEIESAAWFDASNLPELPSPLSLAYWLIEAQIKKQAEKKG